MDIGQLIKEYRSKNNLSQAAFGRIVGVNKQTISKWENGTIQPSTEKFFEIAQALGVPASSMLIDALDGDEIPYVYAHRTNYDVGLNSLYRCVHDFKSFRKFINSLVAAHRLLEPNAEYTGFLLINMDYRDEGSYEAPIPINSIYEDLENVIFELPNYTICLTEENVSHIECIESFNNEAYVINVHAANNQDSFIQLLLSLHNGTE